jgi:hypothetical protein
MSGRKPFAALVSRMSPEARERVERKAAALRADMPLHEVRAALELSQQHLAEILKVDQPAISRMERRTDMLLSTLARFVEAMGGKLELRAAFPEGTVQITGLAELHGSETETRKRRG